MTKMISLEEARELVLSRVTPLEAETVDLLDAAGRVAAADLKSDIDVSPFAHAAMDGYAVRRCDLAGATAESPITLEVIDEVPAGGVFEGTPQAGQCVRIMTGAALPGCFDAVVKYEIVSMVEGDGKPGGRVAFSAQPKERDNVREAGEEARAGEIVVNKGEAITTAGVGFLAGCGVLRVPGLSQAARGHHPHWQRARAAERESWPWPYSQFEQLRPRGMRQSGRLRSGYVRYRARRRSRPRSRRSRSSGNA